jgi:hypothetical protein
MISTNGRRTIRDLAGHLDFALRFFEVAQRSRRKNFTDFTFSGPAR